MTSEIERLRESQKYVVSEPSSEGQTRIKKPHITTEGKEGKLLRKKLAIALGLRTSSSTSTTSQSEGEDVQNVVEVFKRQVRKTVDSRSKNFPRTIQEREQQSPDKSSLIIRKMARKTTDKSGEFLEEDFEGFDDIDGQETVSQEGSKEQYSMAAEKLETFDHHDMRSRDASKGENSKHKTIRKTIEAENINEFLNEEERASRKTKSIQDISRIREITEKKSGKRLYNTKMENQGESEKNESWVLGTRNAKQNETIRASTSSEELNSYTGSNVAANEVTTSSEEFFSSYGKQSERAPSKKVEEVSPSESVMLLREKIRKNTRARQVRRSSRVDRGLEREKTRDNQNQEKIASTSQEKSTNELKESFSVAPDKNKYYDDHLQVSSNIPIPFSRRKTSDTQEKPPQSSPGHFYFDTEKAENNTETQKENILDSKTKLVQKSKIPRRKSENSKDGMGPFVARLRSDEIEGQIVDAKSVQSIDDKLFKKISETEDLESEKVSRQSPWQKNRNSNANMGQMLRNVSKKTKETTSSLKTNIASTTDNNLLTNKSQTSLRDTTIINSRHNSSSSSVRQFDFDWFEAELSKLKASVFKTYEDFKDIRSMVHGVEEELNDLKSNYGV